MQLGPNSAQMQAGSPVVLVPARCGAPSWVAPAAVLHCLALGDASPPAAETPTTRRVSSPADLTGGNGAAWPRCKDRRLDALAGSHSFPCPADESGDHPPPSFCRGAGFSQREVPPVGFSMRGVSFVSAMSNFWAWERE